MNADDGDMTRTSPDDFRTKTSGVVTAVAIQVTSWLGRQVEPGSLGPTFDRHLLFPSWTATGSAGGHLVALDRSVGDRDQAAAQDALTVFASGVDAE